MGTAAEKLTEAGELAFGIVADFANDERVLALQQQQEMVGIHPHDFIR